MKKTKQRVLVWSILLVALIAIVAGVLYMGGVLQTTYNGKEVTLLVPHKAAIKCDVVENVALDYVIPTNGKWISKDDIGFKTKIVQGINVNIDQGFWASFGKETRLRYKLCDANKNSCTENTQTILFGKNSLPFNSIDVTQKSLYIILEKNSFLAPNTWTSIPGGNLHFDAAKYGLNLYSTTGGFTTVCSSSCDLSCPTQDVRAKIEETTKTTLEPLESVNYIEYWTDVSQKSEQFGGTVWDANTQTFCFGGFIYNAGEITTETGKTYIYPQTYTKQVACCNGASTSGTTGDRICENNQWKTIAKDTSIKCTSDVQCPNSGIEYGQLLNNQPNEYKYTCQSGVCVQKNLGAVECIAPAIGCAGDQVCQDFRCVGGSTTTPISNNANASNNKLACEQQSLFGIKAQWIEAKTSKCGFLCGLNIQQPTITTTSYCYKPYTPIILSVGILVVIFLLGAIAIVTFLVKKKKVDRKK